MPSPSGENGEQAGADDQKRESKGHYTFQPKICSVFLEEVFGKDMLNDPNMKEYFIELIGQSEHKPFECVGSRKEVNISLCLAIARAERDGEKLPLLLANYKQTPQYAEYAETAADFGQEWDSQHNLPDELAALVRRECVEHFA